MDFGGWLRATREERGLTQEQVALAVGTSQPTINGWEKKGVVPGGDKIKALAGALSVTVEEIVSRLATTTQHPTVAELQDELRELRSAVERLQAEAEGRPDVGEAR